MLIRVLIDDERVCRHCGKYLPLGSTAWQDSDTTHTFCSEKHSTEVVHYPEPPVKGLLGIYVRSQR